MTTDPVESDAEVVTVALTMSSTDFRFLRKRAGQARLPMEEFLRDALVDGSFMVRNRARGRRVLVETRRGWREFVD